MEQNFQTSFIPKKPIVEERVKSSKPVGFFMILSILIFLSMVLAAGGLYFYKTTLASNIVKMEEALTLAKNRFEPEAITQLQVLDKRLTASKEVLSNHVAINPIFKALSAITMKSVRYTKFSYDLGTTKDSKVAVKLTGQTNGYRAVALQSDLFAKDKNLINPVFSNLTLDSKGNVLFDLEFSVDPTFISYKHMLERESGNQAEVVAPTNINLDLNTSVDNLENNINNTTLNNTQ